jgi:ribosome-binding factor A
MAGKRVPRLNEQFRRELTGLLRTQVRDPRIGFPTITGVDVTPDLWVAKVHVRPDPALTPAEGADPAADLLEGLVAATPFLRREMGRILPIRRVPELRFLLDHSIEHAARIHALLAEVMPPDAEPDRAQSADDDDAEEPTA